MTERTRILVVLPAYNEVLNLRPLLAEWAMVVEHMRCEWQVYAVDDGSTDGTGQLLAQLVEEYPLTVVTHEVNRGLGQTLRDGLEAAVAQASDDDIIITMDADNTHPPTLAREMCGRLNRRDVDVVIASRYRRGAQITGLSGMRRFTSAGAAALFRIVYPVRNVRDYTCGYRAFRAGTLKRAFAAYGDAFCRERSFACTVEVLLQLAKTGARFAEVPLALRYDAREGESKMNVLRTIRRTLGVLVAHRFGGAPKVRSTPRDVADNSKEDPA